MNYYNASGQMDLSDRIAIETGICIGESFKKIAKRLRRHPSTIAHEVKENRTFIKGNYPNGKDCRMARQCTVRNLCGCDEEACNTKCRLCRGVDCTKVCDRYVSVACHKFDSPPYVCNNCKDKKLCKPEVEGGDEKMRILMWSEKVHKILSAIKTEGVRPHKNSINNYCYPENPEAGIDLFLEKLVQETEKEHEDILEQADETDAVFGELYSWYLRNPEYRSRVQKLVQSAFAGKPKDIISQSVAKALYGEVSPYSATRLERFAACAFAHFLQYGMKLTERVEYEFKPMDMGNVMHEALESFAEEVRKRGMKWTELTEQERNEIADRCLDNIVADYGNTVLKSSARNEYMIERTRRILRRTVWALQKQLEQGEFQPEGFEVTFGGGRIDRVDIMEDQNKVYVKVIDYKTGNTSFDLVYLYHGLQLQLMIYLDGALRVEQKKYPDKEIIPAGVFYYNIKDPMIQEKIDADVEAVSAGLMKELKMNGLVQADPELVYRMDSSLGSIPVAFNKDGSFRKNSSVADRTQFAVLGRYVRTKIEKIRSSILEGDAEVSPYELGKKNACTYCPYMTVCGFDRRLSGYEFRRLKNFSDEELWKAFDREAE